jgi:hypothetical protein
VGVRGLFDYLPGAGPISTSRLDYFRVMPAVVVTGARQTGKSTRDGKAEPVAIYFDI